MAAPKKKMKYRFEWYTRSNKYGFRLNEKSGKQYGLMGGWDFSKEQLLPIAKQVRDKMEQGMNEQEAIEWGQAQADNL